MRYFAEVGGNAPVKDGKTPRRTWTPRRSRDAGKREDQPWARAAAGNTSYPGRRDGEEGIRTWHRAGLRFIRTRVDAYWTNFLKSSLLRLVELSHIVSVPEVSKNSHRAAFPRIPK